MRDACIAAVTSAMQAKHGRDPTQAELREIEPRISNQMTQLARQDPRSWRALPLDQRIEEAGKAAADELQAERDKRKQRLVNGVLRLQANEDYINKQIASGQDQTGVDALQRILAPKNDFGNNGLSIESQSNGMLKDAVRRLSDVFDALRPGAWKFIPWENRKIQADMRSALAGITQGIDPTLVKAAKAFHDIAEEGRKRFNNAGGVIGKLDNWDQPHHWSAHLALKRKADFVNDFMGWVDRSVYVHDDGRAFTNDEMRAWLEGARLSVATEGLSKVRDSFPGGGMKANRHRQHRQIHLLPEHTGEALAKYSEINAMDSMVRHLRQMGRDIALLETFGPNPDLQFQALRDKYLSEAARANDEKAGLYRGKARYLTRIYDNLAGNNPPPESRPLSIALASFRSLQIAAKLGSASISSISDSATMAMVNHVNNLNHFKVFLNTLNAWSPKGRRFARRMGLLTETLMGEADRFATDNITGHGLSAKTASFVMRASGLNFLTETRRIGFAVTMMDAVGHLTRRYADVAQLKPQDGRALADAGVSQEIWDVWRQAQLETRGANRTLLSPDAIESVPGASPDLKRKAVESLLGIVGQETDLAVVQPGVRERVQMSMGAETNSIVGELARTVFLFKSFPWAMMRRHWERGLKGFDSRGGRLAYMAALIGLSTSAGILANWINDVVGGRDPRSINPGSKEGARNVLAAFLKGGGLGLYGDFLFSETTQYGGSSLQDTLLGPGVSTIAQALSLTVGNAVQAANGEETNAGAEAIQFARGNLPGANLWMIKGLLDRYIFQHWQEMANPGYNARQVASQRHKANVSYWWRPAEPGPDRAPDLEHAVRPN